MSSGISSMQTGEEKLELTGCDGGVCEAPADWLL